MMSIEPPVLEISGLEVEVIRKDIKNLHIAVYPPAGSVRVAAPEHLGLEAIQLAVVARLSWIKRRRAAIKRQVRQPGREYIDGESHYAWGRRYRLRVTPCNNRPGVVVTAGRRLTLSIHPDSDCAARESTMLAWYRSQLRAVVPDLIAKWAPTLEVSPPEWRIRRMKTLWGSCNADAQRIWLNLELAKKPPECLEYVIAHELAHLVVADHGDEFRKVLDAAIPQWRTYRHELNAAPLAEESWPIRAHERKQRDPNLRL
jgi:predicted metal-dependent hydrolase